MRLVTGVFLLVGVIGVAGTASAQSSWGVKGGVNFATIDSDVENNPQDYRIGVAAGGYFNWPLAARLSFQPEVLYSQQGSALSEGGVDAKIKFDYIAVPLLLRYRLTSSSHPVFVAGGPSIAFNVKAKSSATIGGATTEIDISDVVESYDFGVAVGGGVEFGRYAVEGRYTFGFTNLNKDPTLDEKDHNRVISVLGSVRF
jgi:hypothetical protein